MTSQYITAAIDFGTAFSSWAFSFKHTFKQEPSRVTTRNWKSPGNNISMKTPTCILIQPDGETLDSFGYEAEKKYALLSEGNQHTSWYFFRRFKMQLYAKKVNRQFKLSDVSGKKLPAKTVFALSIKFLKDDLMATARKGILRDNEKGDSAATGAKGTVETSGEDTKHDSKADESGKAKKRSNVEEEDIRWVLTVPAIWNDAAKQFMREAANEAGIANDNLYIGLEPEAASIYCRFLPAADYTGSLSGLEPGSKYMVLDAGGGTVDITVHEVGDKRELKEIHKASGGNWGGTRVDQQYWKFLEKVFGKTTVNRFRLTCMEDYLQMICDFEVKKRLTKPDLGQKVTVRIPASFGDLLRTERGLSLKELFEKSEYKDQIVVSGDKVRIDFDIFRKFFDVSIQETIGHVRKILKHKDVLDCQSILMVGGFSDSIILQEEMKKAFPETNFIVPSEPELCIIKGAVIFGHDPTIIAERKLKCTYGVPVAHPKDCEECHHRIGKTEMIFGVRNCIDVFHAHVRVGQVVKVGEEQEERLYKPLHPLASKVSLEIFSSTEVNPTFVTDASCTHIGTVTAPTTPDILGAMTGLRFGHGFGVTFLFGGTEIKVKAVDKVSGDEVNMILDCLDEM